MGRNKTVYFRKENLSRIENESLKSGKSSNEIINVAVENHLDCRISIKSDLTEFLRVNPKCTNQQITDYLNSL